MADPKTTRRGLLAGAAALGVGLGSGAAFARLDPGSIFGYLEGRRDLDRGMRAAWLRAARVRFGGAGLEPAGVGRPEIEVAKTILARGLFMGVDPKDGVLGAWEGWRSALGGVPPPIAIHYQILAFQGRTPRGRPIDLAFSFPDFYDEEIAPDLVAWWVEALAAGTLPDAALAETREALARTRRKMAPLLLDKLRMLARLDRQRRAARGAARAEIERDIDGLEAELARSFPGVGRRPEVLDRAKAPFDRLLLALDDQGVSPTEDDRWLDPRRGAPPLRPVPERADPAAPTDGVPLVEPEGPPPVTHLPAQPRPGDPEPWRDPAPRRSRAELSAAYLAKLSRTVEPWLHTPYAFGNDTRGVGTDCSGFVRSVFAEAFALDLPRTSRDQLRAGRSVGKKALRPGDLLFFDTADDGKVNHVGIQLGEDSFVHASVSRGVIIERLGTRIYARAFRGARRVLAYAS